MAFGSALRSSTIDYIRPVDIEILRRDVDLILNELFSRDADIRLGGLRSLGALGLGGLGEPEAVDVVRRYNLMVSLINSRVKSTMMYAEVHPKYNDYGEFPREFERGRRVEEFLAMDVTTIDRILQQYNLPRDRRPDYLLSNSLLNRERLGGGLCLGRGDRLGDRLGDRYGLNREHKILILFEWLGVDLSNERLGGINGRFGLEGGLSRLGGGGLLTGGLGGLERGGILR